jgi:hypothetical protein
VPWAQLPQVMYYLGGIQVIRSMHYKIVENRLIFVVFGKIGPVQFQKLVSFQ